MGIGTSIFVEGLTTGLYKSIKMFAIGILWLLAISCITADDVPDVVPTFTWAAESGSISMIIDFHDGGDDDVAVLEYVHDEFGDDEKDEEDDECLMTGYL